MKRSSLRIAAALVFCCGLFLSTGCVKKSEYDAFCTRCEEGVSDEEMEAGSSKYNEDDRFAPPPEIE